MRRQRHDSMRLRPQGDFVRTGAHSPRMRQPCGAVGRRRTASTTTISACLLACLCGAVRPPSEHRAIATSFDDLAAERPLVARLEWFGYRRVPQPIQEKQLRTLTRVLTRKSEAEPASTASIQLASINLAAGRFDRAVSQLQRVARHRSDALLSNTLAAALLERGLKRSSAADLVAGLEWVERALQFSPNSLEARFNRALLLDALCLREQARVAWRAYLEVDSHSYWSDEARQRYVLLLRSSDADRWKSEKARLSTGVPISDTDFDTLAQRFPQDLRVYAQTELFPAWARAQLKGDVRVALATLRRLQMIGSAIRRLSGESLVLDSAAVIDVLVDDPSATRRLKMIAEGHLAFVTAVKAAESGDHATARRRFLVGEELLRAGASPFASEAAIGGAIASFYSGSYEKTKTALARINGYSDPSLHQAVSARGAWIYGLTAFKLGQYSIAQEMYRKALKIYLRLHEKGNAAALHALLGEALRYQGQDELAWNERLLALSGAAAAGSNQWMHNALLDAAESAMRQRLPLAAVSFHDEMIQRAIDAGDLTSYTEALIRRSRALVRCSRLRQAKVDLDQARSRLEMIRDPALRDQLDADWNIASGEVALQSDPSASSAYFENALSFYSRHRNMLRLPSIYSAHAHALQRQGDVGKAIESLYAAIDLIEAQRATISAEQFRISFFDLSRDLFDHAIEMQLEAPRYDAAFLLSERMRARVLAETAAPQCAGTNRVSSAESVRLRLPPRSIFLEYFVLSDQLVSWSVGPDGIATYIVSMDRSELSLLIRSLHSSERVRAEKASIALYEALLRRQLKDLTKIDQVFIVPDRDLVRLPFEWLWDSRRSSFLIEGAAVSFLPSADFLCDRANGKRLIPKYDVLVVADPTVDPQEAERLPKLANSRSEGEIVARLYDGALLLAGGSATRDAFLEAAPGARAIHIAAHSEVNTLFPRGARILLSPSSEAGSDLRRHDISTRDIAELDLRGTEVVVLAGCRTGGGYFSETEGTMSLVRSFLAAGAKSVVGSLRPVDDDHMTQTLVDFHQMVREGLPPAKALQYAQLARLRRLPPRDRHGLPDSAGLQIFGR